MLRQDEDALNEWLIPMFGLEGEAFLAYDNPVPDDRVFDRDTRIAYVNAGILSRNDARAEIGREDVDGADELTVAAGLVPIDMLGTTQSPMVVPFSGARPAPTESSSTAAPTRPTSEPIESVADTALNGAQIASLLDIMARVVSGVLPFESAKPIIAAAFPTLSPEKIDAMLEPLRGFKPSAAEEAPQLPAPAKSYSHKAIALGRMQFDCKHKAEAEIGPRVDDELARDLESIIQAVLDDQAKIVQDWLAAQSQKAPAPNLDSLVAELREFDEQLAKVIADSLRGIFEAGAALGLERLPGEIQVQLGEQVDKWVKDYTFKLARVVNTDTIDWVRTMIRDGYEAGETPKTIGKFIMGGPFGGARAEMIARTETANVAIQGELTAWEASGVVSGKRWLLAPGACEFCEAAAAAFNAEARGLRDIVFERGTRLAGANGAMMSLDYKDIDGPTLHPHCRCDLEPVIEGEE
jgi:hypothetical protein